MQRELRSFTLVLAAATLSACAMELRPFNSVPYRAPDASLPSAQLTALPLERTGTGHGEHLLHHDVQCRADGRAQTQRVALAFWYADKKEQNPTVVALPAGRVYFKYERVARHASCSLDFSALLVAGHAYTIRSEREITLFARQKECILTMVDAGGTPVPLVRENPLEDFSSVCRKPAANRAPPKW